MPTFKGREIGDRKIEGHADIAEVDGIHDLNTPLNICASEDLTWLQSGGE